MSSLNNLGTASSSPQLDNQKCDKKKKDDTEENYTVTGPEMDFIEKSESLKKDVNSPLSSPQKNEQDGEIKEPQTIKFKSDSSIEIIHPKCLESLDAINVSLRELYNLHKTMVISKFRKEHDQSLVNAMTKFSAMLEQINPKPTQKITDQALTKVLNTYRYVYRIFAAKNEPTKAKKEQRYSIFEEWERIKLIPGVIRKPDSALYNLVNLFNSLSLTLRDAFTRFQVADEDQNDSGTVWTWDKRQEFLANLKKGTDQASIITQTIIDLQVQHARTIKNRKKSRIQARKQFETDGYASREQEKENPLVVLGKRIKKCVYGE